MFKQFKVKKKGKKIFVGGFASFVIAIIAFMSLMYGPYEGFRNFWVTSSMTTMSHQYLAKWFFSDKDIYKILSMNGIIEASDSSNLSMIRIKAYNSNARFYKNKYEEEILKDSAGKLYKVIDIQGKKYQGYLVAIYKPEKVSLAVSSKLGKTGEYITDVAESNKAKIAINGGGFYDPDWNSNGALPHGPVIKNGQLISNYDRANVGGGIIGFTKDDKFVLGKWSGEEALQKGVRDAVDFGPFLIVNGKSSFVKGNGGWGIAPRTAIGQRKDGIVLFLIINGRIPTSIGADMVDLCEVMENYGAVNAANMDGGSSTALVIDNKIINKPVAAGKNGLRTLPTFWIVKE